MTDASKEREAVVAFAREFRLAHNPIRAAKAGDEQSEWYWSGRAQGVLDLIRAIESGAHIKGERVDG